MSALEIGLRWKEISYLFKTAIGGKPKVPKGYNIIKSGMYPLPEGGFIVSIDGLW